MTSLQFQYYIDNEDLASISFREFNSKFKDQYPTKRRLLENVSINNVLPICCSPISLLLPMRP